MKPIAVVTSGFPRRSETFALGEILALESRGVLAGIFATKPGDGLPIQPGCESLLSRVRFPRSGTPSEQANEVGRFLEGKRVGGIHAYFAHTPAEVAQKAARRLGVPFGFSVHARDARKVTHHDLAHRANRADCVIACNSDVANEVGPAGAAVHLVPHGVDLDRFQPAPPPHIGPLRILAVGRLVEKKGFHLLIEAALRLKFPFRLRIVGDGPERERLSTLIAMNGFAGRVTLCGALTHAELPQEYGESHVVVAPSIVDRTGDRDGLPNVILEAMASGRPVVASDLGAIRSAVTNERTGFLVPPADQLALAAALERFARERALCERFGAEARKRVERDFELGKCTERFCKVLEGAYG